MALKGKIAYAEGQVIANGGELTILSDTGIGTTYGIYIAFYHSSFDATPDIAFINLRAYIDGEGTASINIPLWKLFNYRTAAVKDIYRQVITYDASNGVMEVEGLIKIAYSTSISLRIYNGGGANGYVLYRIESTNK